MGSKLCRVELHGAKGELFGAMLNIRSRFSMKWLGAILQKVQERVFNSIYREVSYQLGWTFGYMALASYMVSDESFDLIVLDTPPDTHALDFLMRPNILAGFMEKKSNDLVDQAPFIWPETGSWKASRAGGRLMNGIASIAGEDVADALVSGAHGRRDQRLQSSR